VTTMAASAASAIPKRVRGRPTRKAAAAGVGAVEAVPVSAKPGNASPSSAA